MRGNKPHHGLGPRGRVSRRGDSRDGAHVAEKVGSHVGKGNGEGLSASRKAGSGTPDSHLGTAGRGGTGRHGKGDSYKGRATDMSESPTHSWFERLGAD